MLVRGRDRKFKLAVRNVNVQGTRREREILANDVRLLWRLDAVCHQQTARRLTQPCTRKTPSPLRAGKLCDRRGFQKPLKIDRDIKLKFPQTPKLSARLDDNFINVAPTAQLVRVNLDQIVDHRISL